MPKPKPDQPARLPDSELDVLAHLWSHGPSTARQVRDALADRRPMAHATALTFLARLERKSLVTRDKQPGQRGYVYRPTRKPEPTYRRLLDDMTERLFAGSYTRLVSALFNGRKPTRHEICKLRELLDDLDSR